MEKKIRDNLKGILFYVIITAAAIILFTVVLQVATVSGDSMNNSYYDGEKLMCLRLCSPQKGDVVICDTDTDHILIKRVIATEGDTLNIDFDKGEVILNGECLSESYIKEPTYTDEGGFEYPITIPEGCYFVMGDNRNNSGDSRDARVGFIREEQIKSKVMFKIPNFLF